MMNPFGSITLLTLIPLVGGLVVAALPAGQKTLARRLGLGVSLLALAVAGALWSGFDRDSTALQYVERRAWVPTLAVEYFVGVDGMGLLMVMLAALLVPLALLVSWRIEERVPLYFALVLWLEAGLFGAFTALNFFHWFLFWELSLIPAFFLVRLWGGPDRGSAATQFFIYTMAGSVGLLLAFLALFLATGKFDFLELADLGRTHQTAALLHAHLGWSGMSADALAQAVFFGAFLGFAVKVPVLPFHTWLPSTYAAAPTGTTMLLTGALSKMGVYGFLRILLPIFPDQMRAWETPLLGLAVLTIVCSAAAAFAQRDVKRMLAYSSVNHLGYCLLGMFAALRVTGEEARWAVEKAAALNGVLLQMFNHGLTAAMLFGFVALIERRAGGLRGLDDFGGLRKPAPVLAGLMGVAAFGSLGLPGLNGFVGEFLIFKGTFALAPWVAALSTAGLLITAVFLLTFLERVFHGPLPARWAAFPDLSRAEIWMVAPATALMFVLGIYPQLVIGVIHRTVLLWVERLGPC
ncbi:MAG TPA: NADH-quinone oxidoreductase subunit M [Verrucomicrobiota bacterium]|jgi:NADH-quinone oxidoreductase subunit M|nr:NADH-quinone oxidoreductase subunit M [Verrucomicrobiota bacterium]OQC67477.1 MAG: NADH-quinone oxidoreductase subunit M [Verrucomicrobia bacterium ADurb.Bin006]HOA61161.1 NADH-quinone oxidoreductase subunit M [Verrucomicrobiota bacterium]HOF47304.1 NADH-quinone oxidoreductase subunit M [Verrucomicrobiota bacterium]HOG87258.1 NADH-quinone oxidoreductase subunit M [Verrucomicrobiota bacterium]